MLDGDRPVRQLGWWWEYVGGLPALSNGFGTGEPQAIPLAWAGTTAHRENCATAAPHIGMRN